jgi:RNA-directed DNA polymerase
MRTGSDLSEKERKILPKIAELRGKLAEKAKMEPEFKFYALYDKVFRIDVLKSAWFFVYHNKGGPGIDGVTVDDVLENDPFLYLEEIQRELQSHSYKPQPVKRVHIPKGDGKTRPLGIPTVKDRIVQQAVLLILEPIFEADFRECSYGFRPGKSTHQALDAVQEHLKSGRREVYDADLKGYFDSIPYEKLMKGLEQRIADQKILKLIRMWLTAPIVEIDKRGKKRTQYPKQGTPQGGVVSPLLANSFLHWFDKAFHGPNGPAEFAKAKLVRYADDFVVLAKYQTKRIKDWIERVVESRLGLVINREKTKIVDMENKGETLDFLGYSFRYDNSRYQGKGKYLNRIPSRKSMQKARDKIRDITSSRNGGLPIGVVVDRLNNFLRGWSNYFRYGYPAMAFRDIDTFVEYRLFKHCKRRSRRSLRPPEGTNRYAFIHEGLKVIRQCAKD